MTYIDLLSSCILIFFFDSELLSFSMRKKKEKQIGREREGEEEEADRQTGEGKERGTVEWEGPRRRSGVSGPARYQGSPSSGLKAFEKH